MHNYHFTFVADGGGASFNYFINGVSFRGLGPPKELLD